MTKKRLADLLKEEVEKPASAASTGSSETAPTGRTRKRSSAKSTAAKGATAKSTSAKGTVSKRKSTESKSTASKAAKETSAKAKGAATKAAAANTSALNKKITALEGTLKKSEDQIAALQEDVDNHQSRIFELKDALKKAEATAKAAESKAKKAETTAKRKDTQLQKLTAELEEAKETILKLSNKQKEDAAAKAEANKRSAGKAEKKPASKANKLSVRRPYSSYKQIPEYAIQRGTPAGGQLNSMMSDDDIGWVD